MGEELIQFRGRPKSLQAANGSSFFYVSLGVGGRPSLKIVERNISGHSPEISLENMYAWFA